MPQPARASAPSDEWTLTARLVRRLGFGATGPEVDAAVKVGRAAYLKAALSVDQRADRGVAATPHRTLPRIPPLAKGSTQADRKKRKQQLKAQLADVVTWWVQRMSAASQPAPEKITFLWHNHFATSGVKVKRGDWMLAQNQKLRAGGLGSFSDLAYAMLTDAATVYWLDGESNTAAAPNENLSREFMELFALGHGNGYTEQDVREGARALTGWQIADDGTVSLNPDRHDAGSKTLLGVTGNLDARSFCSTVLNRPEAAQYLITRWYGGLVSHQPPSADTVATIARAYGPNRDLSAMFTAMLSGNDFAASAGTLVVSPVEWLVGALRALSLPLDQAKTIKQLGSVLKNLGQLPFFPPSVGGWPSGQAWLTTAAADLRMQTAATLTRAADLSAVAKASGPARLDAVAYLLGVPTWSDRTKAALDAAVADPATLVAVALNSPEYLTN